jgi:Cys-rich protein (TIGR01571 family)
VAIPTGPPVATGFAVQESGSGGYEQFPPLCDFCSAGNNICCYATFCTPCLAGQMFTNVIGRPGCCMRLSVLYTICAIFGYVLLTIAAAPMGRDDDEQGDEGEDGSPRPIAITAIADLVGRVASFVASALLCWTLVKVRQALRNRSGGRLHGNSCEDCVLSWFCTCCTTIQLARYLGWEDKPYNVCSPTGVPESIPV